MAENTLRIALEEKETLFQQQFSTYQKNLIKYPNYIKYDAFKDLKLIFDLYSEIFHLKGFEYNKLSEDNLKKLIKPFSINEKKELIGHLVKSLAKNGNEDEAQYVIKLLNKIEISFYWNSIKSFKNILKSSTK